MSIITRNVDGMDNLFRFNPELVTGVIGYGLYLTRISEVRGLLRSFRFCDLGCKDEFTDLVF